MYQATYKLGLAFLLVCATSLGAQPSEFTDTYCQEGTGSSHTISNNVLLNGQVPVDGEDFFAAIDENGVIIGLTLRDFSLEVFPPDDVCDRTVAVMILEVVGAVADDDAKGDFCPDGYGAIESDEYTILGYDGSTETFYEVGRKFTWFPGPEPDPTPDDDCDVFLNANVAIALPVSLSYLNARVTSQSEVTVEWTSEREENVDYYEVQRSTLGEKWTPIGTLAAAGDSDVALDYKLLDYKPRDGKNFYRLRMVDRDGTEELSGIVVADLAPFGERDVQLFPNPLTAGQALTVNLRGEWTEGAITGHLTDAAGRTLQQWTELPAGSTSLTLPDNLTSGIYALRIHQGATVVTRRILIN